ncbi:hypothetical protein HY251_02580 [bacterium]|nr:hypothetical protein [bacterium]
MAVSAPLEDVPLRSFGRFQVVRTLGRGAHGVVLEAFDTTLKRPVALKLLR